MIEALRQQITAQEAEAAALEAEITNLERELEEFRERYERVVGPAQAKVDAIRAAIEELENARKAAYFADARPLESWTQPGEYESVEEQFRRVWMNPEPVPPPPKPRDRGDDEDEETRLKRLYRTLARRYHPDFAADDADREARTRLMILINEAYSARDLDALSVLDDQPNTMAVDASLEILQLRALRDTARKLETRLMSLRGERDRLLHHDLMKFKVDEKLASRGGRDLLREIAAQVEAEYTLLLRQLDNLRRGK